MKLFRRIFTLFLTAAMCLSLVPGAAAAGNPFTDVPDGEWYAADVQRAYELGLINGTSKTTFSPGEKLHYCEAIKLAACMNQRYEQGRVTLINSASGKWYDSYVAYAVEHNIIWDASDYDWDAVATRAGYMEIFASALPYEALEEINSIPYGAIPDVPEDSENEWAIYHLYRAGIVQGTDAATHACSPNNTILRQEVATILTRMMDKSKRIHFNMSMSDTAALGELNEWIDMDEEGFKDDDGYIALAEWPELLEYMADSAQTLKDDGVIASFSYSEENAYILYTLKTGLWVIYEPRIREYKDYAGGGNVSVFEPYHANTIKFPRLPHQANYPTNARNTIVDLNEGYTPGATLFDSAVTLSQVAAEFNRAKDGVIIWMGHGGWTEETGSGLFIGETYDEAKHKTLRDKKEIAVSTENGRIALLSGFFEKELNANSLDGTLLVLGTCSSLADGRLANALKGKGAACVIGSRTRIRVVGLYDQVKKLIDAFASKDENGKYNSASQAVIEATYNAGGSAVGELSYAFGADYRLVVGKNATVSGTVIDGNTKKPIEKASVSCGSRSTLTDANGAFSFTDMAELSSYTVKVGAGFYEDVSLTVRLTEAQNMTIKMYPAGIIDLYTSPSNASVRLYETNGSRDAEAIIAGGSPIRQNPAGSASHWKMTGLYNGREYLISASANGYYTKNVFVKAALSPGETRITLDPIPKPDTLVTFTVTDSDTGKPVPGAAVTLLFSTVSVGSGVTDANGQCTVHPTQERSSYAVKVEKDGYETLSDTVSVSLNAATGVSLRLKALPDPWANYRKIYTAADLKAASDENYEGLAVLMNNISVSGTYLSVWRGTLEGNGYAISNVNCGSTSTGPESGNQYGAWLTRNEGTIRNVVFRNVNLNNDSFSPWVSFISLIGSNCGTVENCRIDSGSITERTDSGAWAGASSFVMLNASNGVIRNCVNRISVSATQTVKYTSGTNANMHPSYAGGIVLWSAGTVEHCLNMGSVSSSSGAWFAYGGSIRASGNTGYYGDITDCANLGAVSVYSGNPVYQNTESVDKLGLGNYENMSRDEVLACWDDVLNMIPGQTATP